MKNKIFNIAGMIVGAAMIITGIYFLSHPYTSSVGTAEFGADFYKYMYRAAARAANNVSTLYTRLSVFAGLLFIYAGIIDICVFGIMLHFKKKPDYPIQQGDHRHDVEEETAHIHADSDECMGMRDNHEQIREEAEAIDDTEIL